MKHSGGFVSSRRPLPPDVLVLRDLPEERRLSMERFADALEHGFGANLGLDVRSMIPHESLFAKRLKLGKLDRYWIRFVLYPRAARRRRARVYHIVDHGYCDLARALPPERTIVTCHDLMLLRAEEGAAGFRGRRASVLRFKWSTSYLKKVAHVVCDSASTMRDAERLCGVSSERMSVISPGVASEFHPFSETRREQLRAALSGSDEALVLSVSTGHPYKNSAATLRVLAALRREGWRVKLIRVGRRFSTGEDLLKRDLGLNGAVLETGIVSDKRLVELYNVADVLLFPSFYEGYGWPPLEAMACGTPVVASTAPSVAEIVGRAGLLEDPADIAALTRAVRAVLGSEDLAATLRSRGLARAQKFSWERAVTGYRQLYERLLDGDGTRTRVPPMQPLSRGVP
jgi:glycosyltransferase involved in cell wall biosynthesis